MPGDKDPHSSSYKSYSGTSPGTHSALQRAAIKRVCGSGTILPRQDLEATGAWAHAFPRKRPALKMMNMHFTRTAWPVREHSYPRVRCRCLHEESQQCRTRASQKTKRRAPTTDECAGHPCKGYASGGWLHRSIGNGTHRSSPWQTCNIASQRSWPRSPAGKRCA